MQHMKQQCILVLATIFLLLLGEAQVTTAQEESLLFWATYDDDFDYLVQRSNLDGTSIESGISNDDFNISDIVVNVIDGEIYMSNHSSSGIVKSNLDGSSVEPLINNSSNAIALDTVNGKIYWAEGSNPSRIGRADFDGSNVEETIFSSPLPDHNSILGIALDLTNEKIYWTVQDTDPTMRRIQRANFDGTNVEDLVILNGISFLQDIALDIEGGKMWYCIQKPLIIKYRLSRPDQRQNETKKLKNHVAASQKPVKGVKKQRFPCDCESQGTCGTG